MLIEHLLCTRYCSKCLRNSDEWALEVYIVVEGDNRQTKPRRQYQLVTRVMQRVKEVDVRESNVGLMWIR